MIRYVCCFLCLGITAQAETIFLPGRPVLKLEDVQNGGTVPIPVAPFSNGTNPTELFTGTVVHRVYQSAITDPPSTILASLSQQLTAAGYEVRLACIDRSCGGFDFRFSLPIKPPPEMFIDLGNFAFISATKENSSGIMVIASQSPNKAHAQITEVSPPGTKTAIVTAAAPISTVRITGELAKDLETNGFFILSDLEFNVGSSDLSGQDFETVVALADYLSANPHRTIALVGHTDATGSLDGNIALSKKRATAVRALLLDRYGIDPQRIAAEGMGYLAPVAPNTTEVGREQNRRVEVIILPNK